MKRTLLGLLLIAFSGCMFLAAAPDVSGQWILQMERDFRDNPGPPVECTFKQLRSELTVKCGTGAEMKGKITGRKLTWSFEKTGVPPLVEDRLTLTYAGELNTSATKLTGTWRVTSSVLDKTGNFKAQKKP